MGINENKSLELTCSNGKENPQNYLNPKLQFLEIGE